MSYWSYRIIKYADGSGYGLHEVYFSDDGERLGYTEGAITFIADSEEGQEGIILSLERALQDAKTREVLEETKQ